MYVGVNRPKSLILKRRKCIPHVCGGEPCYSFCVNLGYFVFPMYVGVNRSTTWPVPVNSGIPHVCGGEPLSVKFSVIQPTYSPCMWG